MIMIYCIKVKAKSRRRLLSAPVCALVGDPVCPRLPASRKAYRDLGLDSNRVVGSFFWKRWNDKTRWV